MQHILLFVPTYLFLFQEDLADHSCDFDIRLINY
jgi:hypothetical protein